MIASGTPPFAHLHCHTHYSLLDGANKIPEYVKKVKESGMNAAAITDHGNLYGAIEFYNQCRKEEINPILGYEAYIAPTDRRDKSQSRMRDAQSHLTLLAMNETGFRNLMKLSSAAYVEGYHYKPRIDRGILEEMNEGIICLSGCASSDLSKLILADRIDEAKELAHWFHKVFGDRFYFEIQNGGLEIQKLCTEGTVDLANSMGLPLVATNDAHYLNRTDAAAHDVLLCVNTRSFRSDAKRMRMDADEFYVRTPEEMYDAFPDLHEAVARSQEIADRIDIDLDLSKRHFPVFAPPEGKTDSEYLRELCHQKMHERYDDELTDEHWERLDFELKVIEHMGYSSYFLIVWDFVRFAQEERIPCQARGSACGAIVAYLLGLSNVCPIKYDLLFERFLDPNRAEPPDIDIDFCKLGRQKVIDYTKEKYGEKNVAQIGTYGTLKAKAAIRDVCRALSIPLKRADEITKMIPDVLNISLKDSLKESAELAEACETDPAVKEMIDFAIQLEGLAKSAGTHAAGVVVADQPLDQFVPLQIIPNKNREDLITQWDGPTVEQVGLLKMDFLGLRNLTILDFAVKNVKKHRGIEIDPIRLPLDDQETFALLQRGETKGIFQLESGGMRDLLTKMRPDSFLDIIATSALYRPGPLEGGMVMKYVNVKHGQEEPDKVHPIVDEILEETYGVMVYQEQVMRILNRVGGIELSSAYLCIKAISKKKLKTIAQFRDQYIQGAQENGVPEDVAIRLFELIEKFAGYGFNKSHSTAYGAVAYQTAYLKAHYPVEFMAALLSCGMESHERISEHLDDARRMKIVVQPPCVNHSDVEFTVEGEEIRFGMGAIKGVGEQVLQAIVDAREEGGPFKNIFDLCERVDPKLLNRSALETLVKGGALDLFGAHRAQHMTVVERAIQSSISQHRDRERGQKSLFDFDDEPTSDNGTEEEFEIVLPDVPSWTHSQTLNFEKEAIGFYLTSHPLAEYADRLDAHATHKIRQLAEMEDGEEVLLGGMVSAMKKATTKKPSRNGHSRYLNFDLEDTSGLVRCIMWPEEYARYEEMMKSELMCFVKGRADRRGREPNVVVNKVMTIEQAEKEFTKQLAIKFQRGLHTNQEMIQVRDLLNRYPGKTSVVLVVISSEENKPNVQTRYLFTTPGEMKVSCNPDLRRELIEIMGEEFVAFVPMKNSSSRMNG